MKALCTGKSQIANGNWARHLSFPAQINLIKAHQSPQKYIRSVRTLARRGAAFRELESTLRESKPAHTNVPTVKRLEWQSPLEIIKYPDPRLRAVNAKIGVFDESLERLGRELLDTMYEADDGVGLAAPQVGLNLRLMVFNPTGVRGEPDYVLVNPQITKSNSDTDVMEEGCLSFPKIYGDVQRPTEINVKAQDIKGRHMNLVLKDWQARLFQHEYDHLEGVLFHDRMSAKVLRSVKSQLLSLESEFAKLNPGAQIESIS